MRRIMVKFVIMTEPGNTLESQWFIAVRRSLFEINKTFTGNLIPDPFSDQSQSSIMQLDNYRVCPEPRFTSHVMTRSLCGKFHLKRGKYLSAWLLPPRPESEIYQISPSGAQTVYLLILSRSNYFHFLQIIPTHQIKIQSHLSVRQWITCQKMGSTEFSINF